jgi:hypothetical protein
VRFGVDLVGLRRGVNGEGRGLWTWSNKGRTFRCVPVAITTPGPTCVPRCVATDFCSKKRGGFYNSVISNPQKSFLGIYSDRLSVYLVPVECKIQNIKYFRIKKYKMAKISRSESRMQNSNYFVKKFKMVLSFIL